MLLKMKMFRIQKGYSIVEAAELAHINPQSLKNSESGTSYPYPKMRRELSRVYKVSQARLFEDWDKAHAYLKRLGK